MSKILTCILFATFILSTTFGQSSSIRKGAPPQTNQADVRAVEQQILDIENQWAMAFVKHDPSVFQRHVADDYIGIYPTKKITKADLISMAKSGGDRTVVSTDDSTPKVRVFDNAAVVTGNVVQHVREKSGEMIAVRTLYTEVFILKDGVWQCVSGHYTPFATPE